MIYRSLTTVVVIGVIVGAVVIGQQRLKRSTAVANKPESAGLGYAARDAELIETGPDGYPLYRLNADWIRQNPKNGMVDLETVRMTYRGDASSQWALSAQRGTVREGDQHIELAGDVRIAGLVAGSNDLKQVRTEQLSFDPQSQIASTREPVTLIWAGRELEGTGLTVNLKAGRGRLESNIHGLFNP